MEERDIEIDRVRVRVSDIKIDRYGGRERERGRERNGVDGAQEGG